MRASFYIAHKVMMGNLVGALSINPRGGLSIHFSLSRRDRTPNEALASSYFICVGICHRSDETLDLPSRTFFMFDARSFERKDQSATKLSAPATGSIGNRGGS
jgi:hypothetical protein